MLVGEQRWFQMGFGEQQLRTGNDNHHNELWWANDYHNYVAAHLSA